MNKKWKKIILSRIKKRNLTQGYLYKDILQSYNNLIEDKNKLLAIIASLTSDINYSKNNYNSTESTKNVKLEKIEDNNINNLISKKELCEIIKEKTKNEEILLFLKNSLNEKEKLLNIINKNNENLKKKINKKNENLLKKKKKIKMMYELIDKNKKEMIKCLKMNTILYKQLKILKEKNYKMLKQYDNIKFINIKLSKENIKLKNDKIIKNNNIFELRQNIINESLNNEKILKTLLKCKIKYKKQLEKWYIYILIKKIKYIYKLFENKMFRYRSNYSIHLDKMKISLMKIKQKQILI